MHLDVGWLVGWLVVIILVFVDTESESERRGWEERLTLKLLLLISNLGMQFLQYLSIHSSTDEKTGAAW